MFSLVIKPNNENKGAVGVFIGNKGEDTVVVTADFSVGEKKSTLKDSVIETGKNYGFLSLFPHTELDSNKYPNDNSLIIKVKFDKVEVSNVLLRLQHYLTLGLISHSLA